jgi:hypothetical protein
MTVSEKVAYIKGLCVGLENRRSQVRRSRILTEIINVLSDIAQEINDIRENSLDLADEIVSISEDLSIS